MRNQRTCTVDGCDTKHYSLGLCKKHHSKARRAKNKKKVFRSDYAANQIAFNGPFWNTVCVPLTKGQHALMDADDFDAYADLWFHTSTGYDGTFYAATYVGGKNISMHRLVNKTPSNMHTDHINGNGLDNRKQNLRTCTRSQNYMNTAARVGKYKGIYYHVNVKKWVAKIYSQGELYQLGCYATEQEAALAYDKAALKFHGSFARLNFPEHHQENCLL